MEANSGGGYRPALPEGRPREATGQGSPATGRSPPSGVLLFWTLTPPTGIDTLKGQEVPPLSRLPPSQLRPRTVPQSRGERRGASAPPPSRAEAESLPTIPTHHGGPWDPDTPSALGSGAAPDAGASGAQRRVPRAAMDGAWAKCNVGRKGGQGCCHVTLQLCTPGHLELSSALAPRESCLQVETNP